MPLNCPQAISKLKAYKQQHQNLQNQFDEFLSQVPFLPDIKWDEPFMSSTYYKDITKASKDIFNNLYDAKEEARKKLEEFKEEIGYQEPLTEKEFSTLTQEQKIDYVFNYVKHRKRIENTKIIFKLLVLIIIITAIFL